MLVLFTFSKTGAFTIQIGTILTPINLQTNCVRVIGVDDAESECGLDDEQFDVIIQNDDNETSNNLKQQLEEIIKTWSRDG